MSKKYEADNYELDEQQAGHERSNLGRRTRQALAVAGVALSSLVLSGEAAADSDTPNRDEPIESAAAVSADTFIDDDTLNNLGRGTVTAMRYAGPYALALGAGATVAMVMSRRGTSRTKLALSNRGYNTPEDKNRLQRTLAGALVPALGAIAFTTSLSVEEEIRTGPNRVIDFTEDRIKDGQSEGEVYWGLQPGRRHMMNNSQILQELELAERQKLFANARQRGIDMAPFNLELTDIDHGEDIQTSLVLSAPNQDGVSPLYPEVSEGKRAPEEGELVVDAGEGMQLGEVVSIGSKEFEIVGLAAQPHSLLNRSVVFTNEKSMAEIKDDDSESYYGLTAVSMNKDQLWELFNEAGLTKEDIEILSTDEFKEHNSDFWEGNGTALVMLMIANIGAFGGIAMYERKRAEQEQNRDHISALRATGMTVKDIGQIEFAKSAITSMKAAPVAYPVAIGISKMANEITGFNSHVDIPMVAAAAGTVIVAKMAGDIWLLKRLRKVSPAEHLE